MIVATILGGWLLAGWVVFRVWLLISPPRWALVWDRYMVMRFHTWCMGDSDMDVAVAFWLSLVAWPVVVLLGSIWWLAVGLHALGTIGVPKGPPPE